MYQLTNDVMSILAILSVMLGLFVYNRWPYHIVALAGLGFATAIGVVPLGQVYAGIDSPAVITVACIMAISYAITGSGVVNLLIQKVILLTRQTTVHILSFSLLSAVLSGFMNNVGALGLMLPACIQSSWKENRSPSLILMPVAMASALGGMMTLIGTPTNLIISGFREQSTGVPFSLFDFAYVGCFTAFIGTVFLGVFGWRLFANTKSPQKKQHQIYTFEIEVHEDSSLIGEPISTLKGELKKIGKVVGLFRNARRTEITSSTRIKLEDVFILESSVHDIQLISNFRHSTLLGQSEPESSSDHLKLVEAMVPVRSKQIGKIVRSMTLCKEHKMSVVAILRFTGLPFERIGKQQIKLGDMLLLQCSAAIDSEILKKSGLLEMTQHNLQIGNWRSTLLPILIFACSLFSILLGWLPAEIAFGAAVVLIFALRPTALQNLSEIINWPVIVLIAAMIPLGGALISTGAANWLAYLLLVLIPHLPIILSIALIMLFTIILSSFINNAATAVIVSPIAIAVAQSSGIPMDALLMATSVGASASFLTPVAHQNNMLVMEPGNYKFLDFIKLGAPLELLVMLVSCPLIYYFWV